VQFSPQNKRTTSFSHHPRLPLRYWGDWEQCAELVRDARVRWWWNFRIADARGQGELAEGWWMGGGAGYLFPSKERERDGVEG